MSRHLTAQCRDAGLEPVMMFAIDHYRLLAPVMQTGLTMPLAFENIFGTLVPRPKTPEGVDALARRAREYVETVLRGLETHAGLV